MPDSGEIAQYYDSHYSQEYRDCVDNAPRDQAWLQDNHRAYYRAHVEDLVQRSGRTPSATTLVDYGSSIPVLVHEATKLGVNAVAVDQDEAAHRYGAEHGLRVIDPLQLVTLQTESVDVVRFSHVLEHLIDPLSTLRQVVRKVRKGGVIYVTQPNFPLLRPRPSGVPLKDAEYPVHLHYFSPLSLKILLGSAGLAVRQFWTHPAAEDEFHVYGDHLDLRLARLALKAWQDIGDPSRGQFGNYPYYCGQNSEVFATVPVQ